MSAVLEDFAFSEFCDWFCASADLAATARDWIESLEKSGRWLVIEAYRALIVRGGVIGEIFKGMKSLDYRVETKNLNENRLACCWAGDAEALRNWSSPRVGRASQGATTTLGPPLAIDRDTIYKFRIMASTQSTVDYLLEQMAGAGVVSARKMFGEYSIYCDGRLAAMVCDDQLFVKPTAGGRIHIGSPVEAPPYRSAKPCFLIAGDRWDDAAWLAELIKRTAHELPVPIKRSVAKKRSAAKR